ncbi:7040_t:CDS:1, partial [Acaulospora colombiana]
MFVLETMKFYKNHYFKEYYQEGIPKLPARSLSIPNFNKGEEWTPYYTNDIIRPEVMLQRDDDLVFNKNCEISRNSSRILAQNDIENQRDYRGKHKNNEVLKTRNINDNKSMPTEFINDQKNVKVVRNRISKENIENNDEKT